MQMLVYWTYANAALNCEKYVGSFEDVNFQEDAYKIVHEWKDDNHTYNFIAKYKRAVESFTNSKTVRCLHIVLTFHSENSFRLRILDGASKRWEIPEVAPFPYFKNQSLIGHEESCCSVQLIRDPFSLVIVNKKTGEIIFDTRGKKFVYSNYFIQLETKLPSDAVYGFGERAYKFKLNPGIYTIWGRDEPDVLEDGKGGGNIYSHHPVGLFRGQKGSFFLTYMRNSHPKDVIITAEPSLTYKITGGVIDLVFFVGDKYPDTCIKLYHEYIGKFAIMPFWSMGYHQSRWGYKSIGIYEYVISQFKNYDIPLDVLWSDVDYMVGNETFTVDTMNFPPAKMKKMIKDYKIKWVPIIDCGIKVSRINGQTTVGRALEEGIKRKVFLQNYRGDYMLAKVWPGAVFFPDFFHPNTDQYWKDMLEDLYEIVPFSGLWIDMNEVTNFAHGECQVYHNRLIERTGRISPFSNIPYTPGRRSLETKTSSLDAVHYGGILEYDVHELFSIMQSKVTFDYMLTKTKMPFILSRSTSPGNGQYTAHWSGDNAARWAFLQYSIPGAFNFQIFGMPFVGSDICGFMRSTTPDLCIRWYQTGAFYPFARNHNNDMSRDQEPWVFLEKTLGVELLETARVSLKNRYALLKWYYSLFIATEGTGTVFRPLFFEFPDEERLYVDDGPTESQFLLGSSLMVTPKLQIGLMGFSVYFPKDLWFSFDSGKKIIDEEIKERNLLMFSPLNASAPSFIRGGHIIHTQDVTNITSTEELNDEFELVIALKKNMTSQKLESRGSILGVSKHDEDTIYDRCIERNCFYQIKAFVASERRVETVLKIEFHKEDAEQDLDSLGIFSLKIYNFPLGFMEEDEKKIGNTIGFLHDKEGNIIQSLILKEAIFLNENAFQIRFSEVVYIKSDYFLSIKVMI